LAQIELGSALRITGPELRPPGDAGQNYRGPNRALNDIDNLNKKMCWWGREPQLNQDDIEA